MKPIIILAFITALAIEGLGKDEVFLFVGKQTDSQTYEDVPSAELFSLDGGCLPEVAPPPETDRHGFLTLIGEKIIYCLSKESNEGIIPYDSISCSGYNSSENKWDKNYTTTIGRNSRGSAQVYKNKIYFYQFFKHQCVVLDPTEDTWKTCPRPPNYRHVDTGRCLITYNDSFVAFVTYSSLGHQTFNHSTQLWSDWTSSGIELNVDQCLYLPSQEKVIMTAFEGAWPLISNKFKFVTFDIRSQTYEISPYEANPFYNNFISLHGGKILLIENGQNSNSVKVSELDLHKNVTKEVTDATLKNIDRGISSILLVSKNVFAHLVDKECEIKNNSEIRHSFFPFISVTFFLASILNRVMFQKF